MDHTTFVTVLLLRDRVPCGACSECSKASQRPCTVKEEVQSEKLIGGKHQSNLEEGHGGSVPHSPVFYPRLLGQVIG